VSGMYVSFRFVTYITSLPFPIGVGRDHLLGFKHTFSFFYFSQNTARSLVTGYLLSKLLRTSLSKEYTYIHTTHALSPKGSRDTSDIPPRHPPFYQNDSAMRNIADMTGGQPIAV
jgi:hypothetical protein